MPSAGSKVPSQYEQRLNSSDTRTFAARVDAQAFDSLGERGDFDGADNDAFGRDTAWASAADAIAADDFSSDASLSTWTSPCVM